MKYKIEVIQSQYPQLYVCITKMYGHYLEGYWHAEYVYPKKVHMREHPPIHLSFNTIDNALMFVLLYI